MSLTSDDLHDIKQLMEAVVSAAMKEQDEKFEKRFGTLEKRFDAMDERFDAMDRRFDDADEKQDEILNAIGTDMADHSVTLDNHEVRIVRLEKAAA